MPAKQETKKKKKKEKKKKKKMNEIKTFVFIFLDSVKG